MTEEATYTIAKTLIESFEGNLTTLGEGDIISKIYKIMYEYGRVGIHLKLLIELLQIDKVRGKIIIQIGIDSGVLQLNSNYVYKLKDCHRNQLLKIMKERSGA